MTDVGLTHVALPVSDLDASLAFYAKYASMQLVNRRPLESNPGREIAWVSDLTRPFVIVLAETEVGNPLGPFAHLGVACASREAVDRLIEAAREDGCLGEGPHDTDGPAGYFVFLHDPDGHILELSHGQQVGLAVDGFDA